MYLPVTFGARSNEGPVEAVDGLGDDVGRAPGLAVLSSALCLCCCGWVVDDAADLRFADGMLISEASTQYAARNRVMACSQ